MSRVAQSPEKTASAWETSLSATHPSLLRQDLFSFQGMLASVPASISAVLTVRGASDDPELVVEPEDRRGDLDHALHPCHRSVFSYSTNQPRLGSPRVAGATGHLRRVQIRRLLRSRVSCSARSPPFCSGPAICSVRFTSGNSKVFGFVGALILWMFSTGRPLHPRAADLGYILFVVELLHDPARPYAQPARRFLVGFPGFCSPV